MENDVTSCAEILPVNVIFLSTMQIHREIISSSPYLLIHFRGDDTINNKGFLANYRLATSDERPIVYPDSPITNVNQRQLISKNEKRTERLEKYPFLQQ